MSLDDFKLKGKVEFDDSAFANGINNMENLSGRFASRFNLDMFNAVTAANLVTKGVELLTSTLRSALSEYKELDKGIAKVNTLLDKQVLSSSQLRMELLRISEATGIYASELSEASYQALSASVETSNLTEFIEEMVVLSQGGFTSVTKAVDVTTSIMNAYGKEVYTVKEITDKLVTAQKYGKTTVDEMAQSLYNVVPAAASLNIGLDEVLAGVAILTARGVPTAQATTQIRQAMLDLADETNGAGKQFKLLTGKRFVDFIKEGGTLVEAIEVLRRGAKDADVPLLSLFSRIEGGQAAVTLAADNTKEFNKQILNMKNSVGEAEKAQKEATDNMGHQWTELKNRILADFVGEDGVWNILNNGLYAFARNTYDFIKNTLKLLTLPYQLGKEFDKLNDKVKKDTGATVANNADGSQFEEDFSVTPSTDVIGKVEIEGSKKKKDKSPEQLAREREREARKAWLEENKAYNQQRDIIEADYNRGKLEKDIDFFNQISEMRENSWTTEKDIQQAYQDYEYEKFLEDQEFKLQQLEADKAFYENKKEYAADYAETLAKIKEVEAEKAEEALRREQDIKNREVTFLEKVDNSKERLIKGAYKTLTSGNKNILKALGEFAVKSVAAIAQQHGAELLYSGIKSIWDGKLDIAEGAAMNAKAPGTGVALMAAGANEIKTGTESLAAAALFGIAAAGLNAAGGGADSGGGSSGVTTSQSQNIDNTQSVVDTIEKDKTVTIYTDGDMSEILLSMLNTFNELAQDYDNIQIIKK